MMSIKQLSRKAMENRSKYNQRLSTVAGLTVLAAVVAGCSHNSAQNPGYFPKSYQQRHPIIVSEAPTHLDIPVARDRTHLSAGARSAVAGFAADYRRLGAKSVEILVPAGAVNDEAAVHISRHAREILVERGVPSKRISYRTYSVRGGEHPANIRLTFHSVKAHVPSECGVWPSNIANENQNSNYENFGCASQSNLAAIVADPNDLIAPRGNGEINAERSAIILGDFEANTVPTVTDTTISDVVQ